MLESRQRGRFAGFSLYVSINDVSTTSEIKNSTLCYKDETHLPPLDFTAICASRGRYVIFYNERVAGVSYPAEYQVMDVLTELCEVVVQGTEILYIATLAEDSSKLFSSKSVRCRCNKFPFSIIFTRTIELISTELGTMHPRKKRFKCL